MATQAHHEWMKTYLRMLGPGGGSASPAEGSAQSSAPVDNDTSEEDMSSADEGQSQDSSNGANGMSLAAPAPSTPKDAKAEQTTATSANVVTFPFSVPTPSAHFIKTTVGGGRFDVELTAWYQIQGTVELGSPGGGEAGGEAAKKNAMSLFGMNGGKYAASIGQSWASEEGFKIFDLETAITDIDQKISFEANDKELEIAYEAAATLSCGVSVSIKATLIGHEGGSQGETKVCALTLGTNIPSFKVKDFPVPDMRGVTIRGVSLLAHVEGKLQPNWVKIAEDIAKKVAQRAAAEAAFDAGVAGGLVVAAFGVIPATLYQLVEGDDVNNAGQAVNETTHALMDGYRLGITGGQAPSDDIGKLGFQSGSQAFAQALATVKQKVPDVTDDIAKPWIAQWVAQNQVVEKAHDQFLDMAADAAWRRYAAEYSASRMDLMTAFGLIYPEKKGKFTDPLFTKYVKAR
jgi:hypothetical protein